MATPTFFAWNGRIFREDIVFRGGGVGGGTGDQLLLTEFERGTITN